jgi:hypothetical protein
MHSRSGLISRRKVLGGALAGLALGPGNALAEEKLKAAESANLHAPVVSVSGGKLRGFRDGKTFTFLGISYAEADRFELPKAVRPWEGIRHAQAWGPVCPIPASTAPGRDEFVFLIATGWRMSIVRY